MVKAIDAADKAKLDELSAALRQDKIANSMRKYPQG
jgi:hypothetical protein